MRALWMRTGPPEHRAFRRFVHWPLLALVLAVVASAVERGVYSEAIVLITGFVLLVVALRGQVRRV